MRPFATQAPNHIYLHLTAVSAGAAAESAELIKDKKYAFLAGRSYLVPIGLETLGAFGPSAMKLLDDLAVRILAHRGGRDVRTTLPSSCGRDTNGKRSLHYRHTLKHV